MKKEYKIFADAILNETGLMNDALDYIWANPELGYKEWKTCAWLEEKFCKLGYTLTKPENIPGFTAEYDTGLPGPTVAIIGELDALRCATHPDANPDTKAVHACGHAIQTAILLGVAAAMRRPHVSDGLCGKIKFMAIPAEETIDLEYREQLVQKGVIRYMAGKIEFLYRGFFDGVDMAMMFHAATDKEGLFKITKGSNGCITKHFEYLGAAAHAGGEPHLGINALYAASVGLAACNALRETFQEKDYVRYHPIINQAGVAANAIPALASLDTYVRAASLPAMLEVNKKINRAIAASAAALGARVMIYDRPGNLPLICDKNLTDGVESIIEDIFGADRFIVDEWCTQSTDVGDISAIMPVIQHHCMGAVGTQHGEDFYIADRQKSLTNPATVLLCMVHDLLENNAAYAKKVIREYKPVFPSKQEYFRTINKIESKRELVQYIDDSRAVISF
ncbi:MAG: amidohydrolase [Lachnospiraceae bacterium]|nr:amidohydrolase [Lachnospiraceae bacterium]